MSTSYYLPPDLKFETRAMMFVDGENLAIRYKALLGSDDPQGHVVYEPDVFVWSRFANVRHHARCDIIRKYYYTCASGDDNYISQIEEKLKHVGIEAPRVFKKKRGRKTKRVDISLATDMLTHAHRKNYDIAVLVAGDEDYLPLVQAVMAEGSRVVLWFFEDGLSKSLKREVDHYFDISTFLFKDQQYLERRR